jgi:hypothetical protein
MYTSGLSQSASCQPQALVKLVFQLARPQPKALLPGVFLIQWLYERLEGARIVLSIQENWGQSCTSRPIQ